MRLRVSAGAAGNMVTRGKMTNRLARFLLIFLLQATASLADLAIVKTAGVQESEEALNGFASICFEPKQEFDLLEDLTNGAQIVESIKTGNFRLLVAIGAQAATLVRENFSGIPILFCLVLNPEKIGLKGDHIIGIPLNLPIREQFAVLRSIDKRVKRLGVIYTQPTNDSLIAAARSAAMDEGLLLVPLPISSSQDLQRALTELLEKCDALWIPPDPSLNSREVIRYIGNASLAKQIPCVGPNDRYVRSGAIFTLAVDALETGKSVGELANKILKGASPSKLSVPEQQRPRFIINLKAAGLLGLTIPKNIQSSASKVYQ